MIVLNIPMKGSIRVGSVMSGATAGFIRAVLFQSQSTSGIYVTPTIGQDTTFTYNTSTNRLAAPTVICTNINFTSYLLTSGRPVWTLTAEDEMVFYDSSQNFSLDHAGRVAWDATGSPAGVQSFNYTLRELIDPFELDCFKWGTRALFDSSGSKFMQWDDVAALQFYNVTTTTGAAVGTLTNATATGNPVGYLNIIIGGTTRYIPYWS